MTLWHLCKGQDLLSWVFPIPTGLPGQLRHLFRVFPVCFVLKNGPAWWCVGLQARWREGSPADRSCHRGNTWKSSGDLEGPFSAPLRLSSAPPGGGEAWEPGAPSRDVQLGLRATVRTVCLRKGPELERAPWFALDGRAQPPGRLFGRPPGRQTDQF